MLAELNGHLCPEKEVNLAKKEGAKRACDVDQTQAKDS